MGLYAGDENLFRLVFSRPLVAVDPTGEECKITLVIGHDTFVDALLNGVDPRDLYPPQLPELRKCELLAPICCWSEGPYTTCKKARGPDSVVPDWPTMPKRHDGDDSFLWCEENKTHPLWKDTVPQYLLLDIIEKAKLPLRDAADGLCAGNCKCKKIDIDFECDKDMSSCLDKLVKKKKISKNPCNDKDFHYDCSKKSYK